jgi:CheY-like chemotaxis protein
MPLMDGYESTLKIREYLFQKGIIQPIITAVTGHTEESYVKRCYDSGMN